MELLDYYASARKAIFDKFKIENGGDDIEGVIIDCRDDIWAINVDGTDLVLSINGEPEENEEIEIHSDAGEKIFTTNGFTMIACYNPMCVTYFYVFTNSLRVFR